MFINRATTSHKYNHLHRKIKYQEDKMCNREVGVIGSPSLPPGHLGVIADSMGSKATTANKEIKPKVLKGEKEIKPP